MADIAIRRATTDDIPFLVDAICDAEKGGSDRLSYCRIFDLGEGEFRSVLASMLEEDLEGQELAVTSFLVAMAAGETVGAVAAWVEGAAGASSTILKANLLLHFVDRERMRTAQQHFAKLAELTIPRENGSIQIESVYVRDSHRGHGIAGALIEKHIEQLASSAPAGKVQVILTATNPSARAAYARIGFKPAAERWSEDDSLLSLVPSLRKLLMERPISGGEE